MVGGGAVEPCADRGGQVQQGVVLRFPYKEDPRSNIHVKLCGAASAFNVADKAGALQASTHQTKAMDSSGMFLPVGDLIIKTRAGFVSPHRGSLELAGSRTQQRN
jgi:hypothetical protein